jgi:hypothetical protein
MTGDRTTEKLLFTSLLANDIPPGSCEFLHASFSIRSLDPDTCWHVFANSSLVSWKPYKTEQRQWSFFLSLTPVQQQLQQPQQHEWQLYPVRQWHSVHGYCMQECCWASISKHHGGSRKWPPLARRHLAICRICAWYNRLSFITCIFIILSPHHDSIIYRNTMPWPARARNQ